MKLRLFPLLLFLSLALPAVAQQLPGRLLDRLAPVEGVVVMRVGDEYLIDRDATQGVQAGDLFAVVKPGAPVVHPVTGEIIGKLDETLGYLQVSRVRSGYSYARPLPAGLQLDKGATIRRFDGVDAVLVDLRGDGDGVYRQLVRQLPQFNWQGYRTTPLTAESGKPLLIFQLAGDGLSVQTAAGQMLVQVAPAEIGLQAKSVSQPAAPAVAAPTPAASAAGTALIPGAATVAPAASRGGVLVMQQQRQGIWRGPSLSGEAVALAGGDFDGDGANELALLFADGLTVYRLSAGKLQALGQVRLPRDGVPLSLDAFDLDGDRRQELYLGLGFEDGVGTRIIEYVDGGFQLLPDISPWLVRAIRRGDGSRMLAGQRGGQGMRLTAGNVHVMNRRGGVLAPGEMLGVPPKTSIFNVQPLDDAKGGALWAAIGIDDQLQIFAADGQRLWEGNETVGGHRAGVERRDPDSIQGNFRQTVYRSARLDLGPDGVLLVPVNEGLRFLSQQRKYSKSRVVAYAWDGFSLREVWKTPDESTYLADFALFDADNDGRDELVTAIVTGSGWFSLGKTHSVFQVYELP
ncbi:VCBS repeat protein [Geothermobacter ehrlichii]|uniref:VCBS repeat protein n=1 Tax=Geothermobacter ehrlichii TaxID=213224 RepID=A0A5D3WJR7_9BACT|nr:VCBS repeat-containing protein [Geothermobacter ehrlichii]TYO99212.1 VCBS repeat protein [Geothermobacter ehrlichii]